MIRALGLSFGFDKGLGLSFGFDKGMGLSFGFDKGMGLSFGCDIRTSGLSIKNLIKSKTQTHTHSISLNPYHFGFDQILFLFHCSRGFGFHLGSLRLSHLLHFLCHLIGVWG